MDQTILFAFPRHSDFGRMASGSDVRAAALDPANVERLVEADPDDLGRELNFVARRLVSDAAFAVRYESLLMAFMDPRCFDRWAACTLRWRPRRPNACGLPTTAVRLACTFSCRTCCARWAGTMPPSPHPHSLPRRPRCCSPNPSSCSTRRA